MLTLDEAIVRFEAVSKANRSRAESYNRGEDYEQIKANECAACAEEHEQLASWLTELQERREADRWIPASERLPEQTTTYLVTIKFIEDYEECIMTDLVIYNIKHGWMTVDEVIAWKPLPEPYERGDE